MNCWSLPSLFSPFFYFIILFKGGQEFFSRFYSPPPLPPRHFVSPHIRKNCATTQKILTLPSRFDPRPSMVTPHYEIVVWEKVHGTKFLISHYDFRKGCDSPVPTMPLMLIDALIYSHAVFLESRGTPSPSPIIDHTWG